MKNKLNISLFLIILAIVLGMVATLKFSLWASNHDGIDRIVLASLILAIVIDVYLIFKTNAYALVLATAFYSIALTKLITNSVGSFVDAFQGINMFGDSTQVPQIISISTIIGISVLCSIVASFCKKN